MYTRQMMQHSGLSPRKHAIHLRELGAVVKRLHEVLDLLHSGRLPQKGDALRVKGLRLLLDVLFLGEEKELALKGDLLVLAQILA